MTDVPERWIEMFGEGWHSAPKGQPGDRRRAGLGLVLADLRRQVVALSSAYIVAGVWENPPADHDLDDWDGKPAVLQSAVLDLLDTGGSDG